MSDLRIGIIGCGKQAPKHISGLRKIPGVELVVADTFPEFAKALGTKEGLLWVDSPEEIWSDPSIRAVDICTPTPSHAELIERAIAVGKDWFCEKPLCETAEQARALEYLAARSHCIGMIGYVYRFAPIFELAKSLFTDADSTGTSPVLGKVLTAFFRLGGRGSHQVWKHRQATDGGAISEMLVHMVDLALWYFGPMVSAEILACDLLRPERVIQGKLEKVDAEDYVLAHMKTASGVDVICQSDLVTPAFTQFIEVQGENGTFVGSIDIEIPSFLFCSQQAGRYGAGKTKLTVEQQNLFEAQMAEFVRAVRAQAQPCRGTLHDSVLLLETIEMIKKGIS